MVAPQGKVKILFAGICSLILMIGVARFAYTPLLPVMQEQTFLASDTGGWLAAINYVGYLLGALIAAMVGSLKTKDTLYRLGIIVAIVTTAAMAITDNMILWSLSRFFAGLSSAAGLLIGSALVLNWLMRNNHRSELGIHFAGLGLGIAFCSVAVFFLSKGFNWSEQWWWFTLFSCLLAIPAWFWLPRPETSPNTTQQANMQDNPPSKQFFWLMMAAYFCAGYGYAISATFIVAIVDQQPALNGLGSLIFLVIGLAAAPACILWDFIARRTGYVVALLCAFILKTFGIILPALSDNISLVVLSAVLFGFTFIGIVSMVLTMAGRFYPSKPAKLMGKMTVAYGIAQIGAPAFTGWLAELMGNYNLGLWIATGFIIVGAAIMALLAYIEKQEQTTNQAIAEHSV